MTVSQRVQWLSGPVICTVHRELLLGPSLGRSVSQRKVKKRYSGGLRLFQRPQQGCTKITFTG